MPRLVQISFSVIPDDPRVRRHNDALKALGWEVAGVGLAGGRSPQPEWPIASIMLTPEIVSPDLASKVTVADVALPVRTPIWKRLRRQAWFTVAWPIGFVVFLFGQLAQLLDIDRSLNLKGLARIIWTDIGWPVRVIRRLRQKPVSTLEGAMRELERRLPIQALIKASYALEPADIWVANDWTALPVASALRAKFGGVIAYDSHEFATEEYAQNWAWRTYERPIAVTIEQHFISEAKAVTAVSKGIVAALGRLYKVPVKHEVVINAPPYVAYDHVPATWPIKLLYHGAVVEGRGLETLIKAAALWGDGITLSIRGPSKSEYQAALTKLIEDGNVSHRVFLLEPIAMTELVDAARSFDVGVMALPGHSGQNQFALPNKVFEYMGAGLGLIVSNVPEMRHVVEETQTGMVLKSDDPGQIAKMIAELTIEQVNLWKVAALQAAKHHNGDGSAQRLDALYRSILPERT